MLFLKQNTEKEKEHLLMAKKILFSSFEKEAYIS